MRKSTLNAVLTGGGAGSAGLAALGGLPAPIVIGLAVLPLFGTVVREVADIVKREQFARKNDVVRRDLLAYVALERDDSTEPERRARNQTGKSGRNAVR
jgi:hypothetical protein